MIVPADGVIVQDMSNTALRRAGGYFIKTRVKKLAINSDPNHTHLLSALVLSPAPTFLNVGRVWRFRDQNDVKEDIPSHHHRNLVASHDGELDVCRGRPGT